LPIVAEVDVKMYRTSLAVAAISLALSSCGGQTASMPSSSESSPAVARNAGLSFTYSLSVENHVEDWWDGDGLSITWKVSEVDDFDWDGVSRPNAAPPQGFQGLEQKSMSGPHDVRMEASGSARSGSPFVLTPVITIDGEVLELAPIALRIWGGEANMSAAGVPCRSSAQGGVGSATASFSKKTTRGLFMYSVDMGCEFHADGWSLLVRNYNMP
jgi:hypothetical protein